MNFPPSPSFSLTVEKHATGIDGFDLIANGGLPRGRTTLVAGTSGAAKTIFGGQFLAAGILAFNEPGVFVTFEETPDDIRVNLQSLGWDFREWEEQGLFAFVDASPFPGEPPLISGGYDLTALLVRIEFAVKKVGAKRVVLDSIGGIFQQFGEKQLLRSELFRVAGALKALGVTAVITAERIDEYGPISRYGVEEFVSDNVVVLRNVLTEEVRRRTVEILKFRGTTHQMGEWPFTIVAREGLVVLPLSAMELKQKSSTTRVSSGNKELDAMCGGGFFRDSIILVSGPTGTGKTLLCTQFLAGGDPEDRRLLFAFEESREQLFRNSMSWGHPFDEMEKAGLLRVECAYPEAASLEDHLIHMKKVIDEFQPQRIAVDSLSALERVSNLKSFREFVIGLTAFIKHKEIPAIFTATTASLLGGSSITETHISTTTDSIILLRYVEMHGQMRRGIAVLKMRGSTHDKEIREFTIDSTGIHISSAFRNVYGILSGNFTHVDSNELERIESMFKDQGR